MITHRLPDFIDSKILAPENVVYRINMLYKLLKIDDNDLLTVDHKPKKYKKKIENLKPLIFKKTENIQQTEEELLSNNLRTFLNKITKNNYDVQKDNIIHILDIMYTNGNMEKIILLYLEICTINRSLINTYVDLWIDILEKYDIDNKYKLLLIDKYSNSINNITYVDPDVDYDQHCKINKQNDKRRNLIIFVSKLIHKNHIDKNQLIIFIHSLISRIREHTNDISNINITNEYVEMLYLCLQDNITLLKDTSDWININNFIKEYMTSDKVNKIGISSRATFKMMDINDKI
tara:strand:- start:4167 stop:5039 length:873 start_codon:yes stop_codon:yes gene_type:complete